MMAEEKASEDKVLEEADESDAHMCTLDNLEADAESDGAPDMSDSSCVTSIFESLHSPVPSALVQKLCTTPPPSGLRKGKGVAKGNPKGISPSDCLREFTRRLYRTLRNVTV